MKAKYNISDIVYLITDKEQNERMITAILFRFNYVSYELTNGTQSTWHTEIEITNTKDILKAILNND